MSIRNGLGALLLSLCTAVFAQEEPRDLKTLMEDAEDGEMAAQFELGNRYLSGDGVEADNFEAARWFRMAAEQGDNNAQYNLGVMYMQGTGVIADLDQAIEWFSKAAEQGDPPAQFTMATLYANGKGVPRDPVRAHMWFTVAASAGHRAAQANVVLFQEMLSDLQISEGQRMAREWIEKYSAEQERKAAATAPENAASVRAGTP